MIYILGVSNLTKVQTQTEVDRQLSRFLLRGICFGLTPHTIVSKWVLSNRYSCTGKANEAYQALEQNHNHSSQSSTRGENIKYQLTNNTINTSNAVTITTM